MMQSIEEAVASTKWFHAIDFGNFSSAGRFQKGAPQNITLYGAFEFLKRCTPSRDCHLLDIGTYDGIVSFGAKRLGFSHIDAVDAHVNNAFKLARDILNYSDRDIRYRAPLQIKDLHKAFDAKKFDLIVNCGIIYHMLYPMEAFVETRKLLKSGGFMILETPYDSSRDCASLSFNGVSKIVPEPYTYFVPTLPALKGMAALCGFQVLGERLLKAPKRVTLLLKASSRQDLIDDQATPDFVKQMLKRDLCDNHFKYAHIESETTPETKLEVDLEGVPFSRLIDPASENPDFPYHPAIGQSGDALGTTRFEQEDGNTLQL